MVPCLLVCRVCVCVRALTSMDLHFPLSWIFAFRIFVYVFASAPLSHFGCLLKTQFSVCALRFILNYISFILAGRWLLLLHLEWGGSARCDGGGEATNKRTIFNMRTRAFAACNIDNNRITSNIANNQLVMNATCFSSLFFVRLSLILFVIEFTLNHGAGTWMPWIGFVFAALSDEDLFLWKIIIGTLKIGHK